MEFLNWPIKTYIWKSGDQWCGVFTTRVSLRHTTILTYSYASMPLDQSERAYYLSYFMIKDNLQNTVSYAERIQCWINFSWNTKQKIQNK